MIALFLSAVLLGLVFSAVPGAVFAQTVRQAVRCGFPSALQVQIGSLVGDATWAVLGLFGVGLLLRLDALRLPVTLAGIAYLVWLAHDSWRAADHDYSAHSQVNASRSALRTGIALSLTNPQNVAYWAAIGSAMGAVGVVNPTFIHYSVFFAGFMSAAIFWAFFCAAVVARVYRNGSDSWAKVTYKLCSVAFLTFAFLSLKNLVVRYWQ
jgi:chemosensory pili system protein ChpE/L-lysine exporter family protein LysE/ArgO